MKFKDINFRPEIHTALEEMGYTELSPIQNQTLLAIIERRDIVAIAETGSGKTSACGIPLIHLIDEQLKAIQVLVMVPTRELAQQYLDELDRIGKYTKVSTVAVFGGVPANPQRQLIKHGAQLVVATPGRLIDLLHTGEISFKHLQTLVLDEADEMLNMGFLEDVEFIMSCIVTPHQTLLFSATMPKDLDHLIHKFLHDPERIQLNATEVAPRSIAHEFIYSATGHGREEFLVTFLQDRSNYRQVLVFCNSRFKGDHLYRALRRSIPRSEYLHGGMDQDARTRIFNRFKSGDLPILIATDVAGRGLDFSNVSHVINFDFPRDEISYTHRTGRTGRMGRSGVALSYVTDRDIPNCFRIIEKNGISPLWHGEVPSPHTTERPRRFHR